MEINKGFVYIMASKRNGTLYIGVTNNLIRRVAEHISEINKGFTNRYSVKTLVYYEPFSSFATAIKREKQLKSWKRAWKIALIERNNPQWQDLSTEIGVDKSYVKAISDMYKQLHEDYNPDDPEQP